jgi:hypothetical protein
VTDEATGENENVGTDDHDTGDQVEVVDIRIPPDTMKLFTEKLKK